MNPYEWWLKIYEMWMDLWFEVNSSPVRVSVH